jgi:hypothetical protein
MTATTTETVTMALNQVVRTAELKARSDLALAQQLLAADPDVFTRVWERVDALARHRKVDPELRAAILRVAEKVAPDLVGQLKEELDLVVPAAVLEAHAHELIPDVPAVGAFLSAATPEAAVGPGEWVAGDPERLRGIVFEVCRFCKNNQQVAESVLELAQSLGIDLELAAGIVGHALLDARHPQAVAK